MRPVTDIMRDIRAGKGVLIATDQLAQVVKAVDATGKAGTITIKLKIEPEEDGGNQKVISMESKMTLPTPEVPKSVFFSDESGDLHRDDPKQGKMFNETDEGGGGRRRLEVAAGASKD